MFKLPRSLVERKIKEGLLPGVTMHACNPSAGEAEEEGGHKFEIIKGQCSELKPSLQLLTITEGL